MAEAQEQQVETTMDEGKEVAVVAATGGDQSGSAAASRSGDKPTVILSASMRHSQIARRRKTINPDTGEVDEPNVPSPVAAVDDRSFSDKQMAESQAKMDRERRVGSARYSRSSRREEQAADAEPGK